MSNSEIIATYFKAIQTGDLAKLGALVAADVIWHQPGDNQFSGTHTGRGLLRNDRQHDGSVGRHV